VEPLAPLRLRSARLLGREAGRADRPALQACLEAGADYFELVEGAPPSPDAAERLLDEAEADPLRRVLLLRATGRAAPLGCLDLWLDQPEPGTAHLGLLLVAGALRHQGYGAEATGALEQALGAAGYVCLRLSVTDENPGARAFWERVGFAEVGRLEDGVTVLEKVLGR